VGKRFIYWFGSYLIGSALGMLVLFLRGKPIFFSMGSGSVGVMNGMGITCSSLLLWYAERNGKVKTIEELHRPLTLFPRDHA